MTNPLEGAYPCWTTLDSFCLVSNLLRQASVLIHYSHTEHAWVSICMPFSLYLEPFAPHLLINCMKCFCSYKRLQELHTNSRSSVLSSCKDRAWSMTRIWILLKPLPSALMLKQTLRHSHELFCNRTVTMLHINKHKKVMSVHFCGFSGPILRKTVCTFACFASLLHKCTHRYAFTFLQGLACLSSSVQGDGIKQYEWILAVTHSQGHTQPRCCSWARY